MALALVACAPIPATTTTPPPSPPDAPTPTVAAFWAHYPPALRGIIDEDAAAHDCESLQATFDTWGAADDLGGKVDLLVYIDAALEASGCYV